KYKFQEFATPSMGLTFLLFKNQQSKFSNH
ncbi:MAG: hypothetical protein ACI9RM_001605, partial [Ulvibacter sp.]